MYLFGLALLGTFINRIFWSKGIDLTTASNASLLATTSPIFVLLISFSSFEPLCPAAAMGILVSFVGVSLVIQETGRMGQRRGTRMGRPAHAAGFLNLAFFTVLAKF